MISQLHIQGLAVINELTIDFEDGFNVITGETGAGKSILIKALTLLLGGKANADVVRTGLNQASVCGQFFLNQSHPVVKLLVEGGISAEESEGELAVVIRRSVSSKGRSQAWVNEKPVTIQFLKSLGLHLVDIFGQHDGNKILDPAEHIHFLDQFVKNKAVLSKAKEDYAEYKKSYQSLSDFLSQFTSKQSEADYLRYRYDELSTFNPSADDYVYLRQICKSAATNLELKKTIGRAKDALDGDGRAQLSSVLWQIAKDFEVLPEDGAYEAVKGEAQELASRLDDFHFTVGKLDSGLEFDEVDLDQAQERLSKYQEYLRHFSIANVEELVEVYEELGDKIAFLDNASATVVRLLSKALESAKTSKKSFAGLSDQRVFAVKEIKKRIEGELADLSMPDALLDVKLSPVSHAVLGLDCSVFGKEAQAQWAELAEIASELSSEGLESAQFYLRANRGEKSLPLQKVASGGEVSRIMLALKKALSVGAETCILVFDEIDSGISGEVATKVGRKMSQLAANFQVICISHLAQVAAFADVNFKVLKTSVGKRTESTIQKLSASATEEELARLLSGEELTSSSLENARNLKKSAMQP